MGFDWGAAGRGGMSGLGSGAGLGAAIGTPFGGFGGVVGGGIGALAGLIGGGIVGGLSGGGEEEAYNALMAKYVASPEYQRQQVALNDMQTQATTQGPTVQEKAALDQALGVANDQFGASYGHILSNLRARSAGGGGGAAQAALAASEGQARSNNMFGMAEQAASQEDQRRQQARQAYAQMAQQAQQIGDQYRRWASGKATGDSRINEAAAMGTFSQGMQGLGAIGAAASQAYNPPQPQASNAQRLGAGTSLQTTHLGQGGGAGGGFSVPDPLGSAPGGALDLGFSNYLMGHPSGLPTMQGSLRPSPDGIRTVAVPQNPSNPWVR